MNSVLSILMGGILPFGAVFIELFFIMSSIWLHRYYYLFGFLFIVFLILVITCAEISVVMVYFQLVAEVRSYLACLAFFSPTVISLFFWAFVLFYSITCLLISNNRIGAGGGGRISLRAQQRSTCSATQSSTTSIASISMALCLRFSILVPIPVNCFE
jgi:hypothetical protein